MSGLTVTPTDGDGLFLNPDPGEVVIPNWSSSTGALRARLFENGYRVVPVKTGGKHPLLKSWTERARTETATDVATFDAALGSNTGILCDGLRALDIDIDDSSLAGRVRGLATEMLGPAPVRTRADSARMLLLFRADTGSPLKEKIGTSPGPAVEVLGHGQQFVAFGRHPAGADYEWAGQRSPLTVSRDQLPAVSQQQVAAFLEACRKVLGVSADAPRSAVAPVRSAAGKVAQGGRTNLLVSLAGTMNRRGMSPEAIEAALLAENERRCVPPLPEAKVRGIACGIPKRYPHAVEQDWPDPEPLGGELPPVPSFDPDLLPESLRPWVEDVAVRMQVALDFAAVAAITTLAGITNRRALIQPKRNDSSWVVVPNLWGAIVADPGTLKSPTITCMTKPLRDIEDEWHKDYENALIEFEGDQEKSKLEHSAWQDQFKAAVKKSAALPDRPPCNLEAPIERRAVTSDATFESLHQVLSQNPGGLHVLRDELIGLLAGFERQGREQERSFYLQCWNGDSSFTVDRIGRGSVHVPHACISLFGGIQPARLRSYLADVLRDGPSNDGLIQRFQLLVWPDPPSGWEYIDRAPDQSALALATTIFRRIAEMDPENPLRLKFSEDAQQMFIEWLSDLEARIRRDDTAPVMRAHLSKYRSLMPSLALLFALADNELESVSLRHAQQAADWCDYLEAHARRVYASRISPERLAAITLGSHLEKGWKRKGGSFTVRDVYRPQWSGLTTPEEARAALRLLEDYGWVRRSQDAQADGRPSENYLINPKIGGVHADN